MAPKKQVYREQQAQAGNATRLDTKRSLGDEDDMVEKSSPRRQAFGDSIKELVNRPSWKDEAATNTARNESRFRGSPPYGAQPTPGETARESWGSVPKSSWAPGRNAATRGSSFYPAASNGGECGTPGLVVTGESVLHKEIYFAQAIPEESRILVRQESSVQEMLQSNEDPLS